MKLIIVLSALVLICGCSTTKTLCKLTDDELKTLQTKTQILLNEPEGDICNTIIINDPYCTPVLPGYCLVTTEYSGSESCNPVIDGLSTLIYKPESLEPINIVSWPAHNGYLRDLKKTGHLLIE
ncbi:hypothetical protein MAH1_15270 [Sessilibacter sp. MAH1]